MKRNRRKQSTSTRFAKSRRAVWSKDDFKKLGEYGRATAASMSMPVMAYGATDVTPRFRQILQQTMNQGKPAPKAKPGPVPDPKTCDIVVECIILERQGQPMRGEAYRELAYRSWPDISPPLARKRLTSLRWNAKHSGLWADIDKYLPRT